MRVYVYAENCRSAGKIDGILSDKEAQEAESFDNHEDSIAFLETIYGINAGDCVYFDGTNIEIWIEGFLKTWRGLQEHNLFIMDLGCSLMQAAH